MNKFHPTHRDYGLLAKLATTGSTLQQLETALPLVLATIECVSETVIDRLYPSGQDPWLTAGDADGWRIEGRRSALRGKLGACQWIIPNSPGTSRRFVVVGFCFHLKIGGEPGPDSALAEAANACGRILPDICAAALVDLARRAPLVLVVSDAANGLLEGWFFCQGVEESLLRAFMAQAIRRGASDSLSEFIDPYLRAVQEQWAVRKWQIALRMLSEVKHWDPLSPVLMPGGSGSDGSPQKVVFFNPEAVRA